MIISSIRIRGFRSIRDSGFLPMGPVTLVVGRNNSGKSALLRAIYLLQEGNGLLHSDVRFGSEKVRIDAKISEGTKFPIGDMGSDLEGLKPAWVTAEMLPIMPPRIGTVVDGAGRELRQWPSKEPENLVFPIFSGRSRASYEQQVRREQVFTVEPTDANIVARVSSLASSRVPEAEKFRSLCESVLGVNLSVIIGENGQRLGTTIDRFREISLNAMGTGVTSALNLLVSLSGAKGKIFLVEEPENDLHPKALKALLRAMEEASESNQFIVTTHSSIVLGHLGAVGGSVVLRTHVEQVERVPETSYSVVDGPEERLGVLRHLGYELADFDLGEGWLIFEESSAERIAREWLIPWFAPGLMRLRTLAAAGTSRVGPIMEDFREIFLFAHLEAVYRNRAWVLVDGDDSGKEVIGKLREKFKGWNPENFQHLDEGCIERYYPSRFYGQVERAFSASSRKDRQSAKRQLLRDVLSWIEENPNEAKLEFERSAKGVIEKLREIEACLKKLDRI